MKMWASGTSAGLACVIHTDRHISTQDVLLRYPATPSTAWSCFNYPECTSGNDTELSNTFFTFSKRELFWHHQIQTVLALFTSRICVVHLKLTFNMFKNKIIFLSIHFINRNIIILVAFLKVAISLNFHD